MADRDDTGDAHFVPAPCQVACPVGTDAPSYIAYVWKGEIEKAYEAISATNPFSSICGRVCDAPCEPACRRADSDGPVAIRNLKRYVIDKLGQLGPGLHVEPVTVNRPESIGIVGGGPAGLTAAQDLAEAGFAVHVYEMSDRLGGMMVWGIPAFRLPPGVIAEDIDRLLARCTGISIHCGQALGRDVSLAELKERHDAVLLAIGASQGKSVELPGSDDTRLVDGVEFLRRINGGERPVMPGTVLVVGGGDVAMDACRAARRLPGCQTVRVIYRRGPNEIPARRDELAAAEAEGIDFVYHSQPVAALADDDGFALHCLKTELGEPDADGRRRPKNVAGSEFDIPAGLVIMAVGQEAVSEELAGLGLMAGDRVDTDWQTMRTRDPQVFAAGDGAFGGSTIVMAMHHGQRAAYYIQAFIDGIAEPLPYRTPYRTRRVAVAQDADWEINLRIDQVFHGLGTKPAEFPEIESTYNTDEAVREAARCYRCDAETASADYSVRTREDIFAMARNAPGDVAAQQAILHRRLKPRDDPFAGPRAATLEDLVFLPANLSRLVIDPYRDACSLATTLCGAIHTATPFLVAGFDGAPEEVRRALAEGMRREGSAYVGRQPLEDLPWLQVIEPAGEPPADAAAAHIFRLAGRYPADVIPANTGRPNGLALEAAELAASVPVALEAGFDFLLLLGNALSEDWADGGAGELAGHPDLSVIRDAIHILRRLNHEEDLEILYFGGVRSGTDGAKLIGLGAHALVSGLAMAFALGGRLETGRLHFDGDRSPEERADAAASFLSVLTSEASIMARCTGKTNVHNIEPEDLRAITLLTAVATGIPLAGTNPRLGTSGTDLNTRFLPAESTESTKSKESVERAARQPAVGGE